MQYSLDFIQVDSTNCSSVLDDSTLRYDAASANGYRLISASIAKSLATRRAVLVHVAFAYVGVKADADIAVVLVISLAAALFKALSFGRARLLLIGTCKM